MKRTIIFSLIISCILLTASVADDCFRSTGAEYNLSQTQKRELFRLTSSGGDKFNLNTISKSMLSTLPYVGKHADEICRLRDELGGFESLEQLGLIPGISPNDVKKASNYLRIVP